MNSIGFSIFTQTVYSCRRNHKLRKLLGTLVYAWVIVEAFISCYHKARIISISFNPFLHGTAISWTLEVVSANYMKIITISKRYIPIFYFGFSYLVCSFNIGVWKCCSPPGIWAVLHHLFPILSPLEPVVKHFYFRLCLECNSLFYFLLFLLNLFFLHKSIGKKKNSISRRWPVNTVLIHLKVLWFKS